MTDRKFTDDDVMKALEVCASGNPEACAECPYEPYPCKYASRDALNLINRQKAEIERLESLTEQLGNDVDVKLKYIYELEEQLKTAKSEAIKEFAKRLKAKEAIHFCKCGQPFVYTDLFNGEIDNIVKEMTEENK